MISIFYISVAVVYALAADGSGDKENMWVVHVIGGEDVAKAVARDVGLTYRDKGIAHFKDHYVVLAEEDSEVDVNDVTRSLFDQMNVQLAKYFQKQSYGPFDDTKEQADLDWFLKTLKDSEEFVHCKTGTFACSELSPHLLAYLKYLGQTDVEKLGTISTEPAFTTTLSTYEGATKHLSQDPKQLSAYAVRFSDPNWRKQWYVQDYRTENYPVMDHNVVPLYFKELFELEQDLTGFTVTVGVIGDGVMEHPDLDDNYVDSISYNFCDDEKGSTPNWRYALNGYTYDTLGTSSAGVIAMKANNDLCGVGIAPRANIAGLRTTGCDNFKPNREASALSYNLDDIDIYCNTWTTKDDPGKKLAGLPYTVERALKLGTTQGRKKKGAIYVFPSGSNRQYNNCAANGYVNNPYVITIASANSRGNPASYSERCAAVFATAYSGDIYDNTDKVTTISANGGCSTYARDKPVAPAIASGIIALVLQYRPYLTYRDIMHLIAMSAEVAPLANHRHSWHRNSRGLWVSTDFGFGLLNAKNMISLAKDWQTVPEKYVCVLNKKFEEPVQFDSENSKTITIDATECNVHGKKIKYLEHVELVSTIDYTIRGAVQINITSPAKTNTAILKPRIYDYYRDGIKDWSIMSVHNWGENPIGHWDITVMACRVTEEDNPHGYIREFTLKLHGTEDMPAHYNQARHYAAFRLPNGDTNKFV